MLSLDRVKFIEFENRYWELGFFVTFRVPFTRENYEAIVALPDSANIQLIP